MTEDFLAQLVSLWEKLIQRSREAKHRQFGKTADRAWAFLGKNYQELYIDARDDQGEKFPFAEGTVWKTRRNLSREYISVMLPYIHARVPNRLVLPRRPGLPPELLQMAASQNPEVANTIAEATALQKGLEPDDALRAHLLKWWLNYLPDEYDLYSEQRRGLPEALVKGRCVVWHEVQQSAHGLIPVSTFDSIDGLLCDPDSRSWREQGFVIRERCEHVVRTAKKFSTASHRIDPDELRGKYQSNMERAKETGNNLFPHDQKGDVCVYYEIYTRGLGLGQDLDGAGDELQGLRESMSALGENCYLAIMPGIGHPLNLWPADSGQEVTLTVDELKRRIAWNIPFHQDMADPWPCSVCDFAPNQNDPWATSPLEGALPLLAFIDHSYCYLLSRVRTSSRNLYLASKALTDAVVNGLLTYGDLEFIPYPGEPGIELDKLLKRVEFPEFRRDLIMIIEKAERAFEKASGMDPLLGGAAPETQDRSATATSARETRLSSRPNDFADCVEHWNSRIASKEAIATRLYVGKDVIGPFFGETDTSVPDPNVAPEIAALAQQVGQPVPMIDVPGPLTRKWLELVLVGNDEMSPDELADAAADASLELTYTVEAGSGRRKNRQKQAEDFSTLVQTMGPFWTQLATAGMAKPYNALMALGSDVFDRSMDAFMLPDMPPQGPQGPSPEEQQAAAEQDRQRQEMEMQQQTQQQDMKRQESEMAMQGQSQEQELAMQAAQHEQEMRHREETHAQDMRMKKAQAQAAHRTQRNANTKRRP